MTEKERSDVDKYFEMTVFLACLGISFLVVVWGIAENEAWISGIWGVVTGALLMLFTRRLWPPTKKEK